MAGLINVAVLPDDVRTVGQALDWLLTLPSTHAFVVAQGTPLVVHAADLLAARTQGVTAIGDVEGHRLVNIPAAEPAPMRAGGDDAGDPQSVFASGNADEVYGPVFSESGADYLLAGIAGGMATLVTRREVLEAALGQAACECDGNDKHSRDGQRSDTGKNCDVPGCEGKYTCY